MFLEAVCLLAFCPDIHFARRIYDSLFIFFVLPYLLTFKIKRLLHGAHSAQFTFAMAMALQNIRRRYRKE